MKIQTKIKKQFLNSVKCGTGEALIIARKNPEIDFSTAIIKGAIKNYAYDGQCEDSRAQYIFDLILTSNKKDRIKDEVLNALANEQEDTWTLTHLFDLAKLFAEKGDLKAKKAIYNRFLHHPIEASDWVGYCEILELDGLNGMFFIAEKFGKKLKEDSDDWQDDHIINHFQDDNPSINVLNELENKAKTNNFVHLYIENIKNTEKNRKNRKQDLPKFNSILDEILNSERPLSFHKRKNLNNLELQEIGEQLIIEKDKFKIERLINIFTEHKFPLNSHFILNLAKQRKTSKNRIQEYALYSLKHLKGSAIRKFALSKISKTNNPSTYTDILISNYSKGDYKLLSKVVNKFNNEFIIESLACSYSELYSKIKTTECKEPLEILYAKMNCGIHRKKIIEILLEINVLSDKIKEEMKFDSYLETRELTKKSW